MEKLGVEVDQDKVKEAEQKSAVPGQAKPGMLPKPDPETEKNVPWDPEKGTEPFEKRRTEKKEH